MPLKKNFEAIAECMWSFVLDFQNGNLSEYQLNMEDSVAIHSIIEAAKSIAEEEVELHRILNKSD